MPSANCQQFCQRLYVLKYTSWKTQCVKVCMEIEVELLWCAYCQHNSVYGPWKVPLMAWCNHGPSLWPLEVLPGLITGSTNNKQCGGWRHEGIASGGGGGGGGGHGKQTWPLNQGCCRCQYTIKIPPLFAQTIKFMTANKIPLLFPDFWQDPIFPDCHDAVPWVWFFSIGSWNGLVPSGN